ncbi:BRCT domain-containing protein [Synechococcus sp. WH 8016]|uniref:BRCT domain-containing protein n=1 Tax=Synechococcus sp. WH 8016 TaxID=166318 RepID=UPI00022DA14E|nr:BRCT domain-containing protein [Synechococcus sp. WH 8016]EHA63726.1 BRCT domain protein [Synechococcus sp. WH 8016]
MSASISNEELLAAIDAMHGCGNESLENWQDKLDFGYEEFLEQFNQAKFDGKKTEAELESVLDEWLGAENIELCPEKQAKLVTFIAGIATSGSDSWVRGHEALKYSIALTDEVSEERVEQIDMADFATYVDDDVVGHGVTGFQYISAAVEWCKKSIKEDLKDATDEEKAQFFESANYAYSYVGNWEFGQDAVAFVQRNPEWRNNLWLFYFENEDFISDSYEPLFMDQWFVEEFQEELKLNAKAIYKRWCDDGNEDLYNAYGPEVEEIFAQSGVVTNTVASFPEFKPKVTGRSRLQIREAFLAAAVGGAEDTTGIWKLLESKAGTDAYPEHGREMQRLVMYIASRLEKSNSNLAGELETSTTGFHIYNMIDNLVQNRRWEKFELPTDTVEPAVEEPKKEEPVIEQDTTDDRYAMLVLISEDDYEDCIAGDPDEEGDWEPVINQATDAKCWRYVPAKAYLNENGERLSEEEHAKKYKMSLDVISFVECCYSPKWSHGFDYSPLWEAAMSDGSIDGDEVDVDQLSQMIKDRKYWAGDNGGYVVADAGSDLATLVQRGLDGLEGNAWLSGHQNVAASFFLAEAWDSGMKAVLSDFAQYVHEQEVSEEEYLNAGKPVVENYVAALLGEQNMKASFQWAWDTFSQEADNPFTNLSLAYIKRHPEHRDALWEMLFAGDAGSDNWEELLQGQWFDEFKDKIELSAKTINHEWGQGGDFSDFGAEVAEVFKRGLSLSTTPATIDFSGKRVCVTGKLSQTRKEVEALLEAAGATIASGVSKTTDFLVAGDESGSKLAKAQELGVTVLTEEQMMAALGQAEDESAEGEISDDEWPSFCEQLHSAGNDPDAFGYVLGQYILNNAFTEKMIGKLKKIYASTNSQELNLFDMPSESDFVEYCKKAVVEYIQSDGTYQVGNKHFNFGQLYFAIDADTVEDTAKQMLSFAQQNADKPHIMERFTSYLLDSSESGIGDNYLCLMEPFWSAIKPYILDSEMLDAFTGCTDKLYCDDMSAEIAELFEQPDVRKTLAKGGVTVYTRTLKD